MSAIFPAKLPLTVQFGGAAADIDTIDPVTMPADNRGPMFASETKPTKPATGGVIVTTGEPFAKVFAAALVTALPSQTTRRTLRAEATRSSTVMSGQCFADVSSSTCWVYVSGAGYVGPPKSSPLAG